MKTPLNYLIRFLRWATEEAWEKINVVHTAKELWALGLKYGFRFFVVAVIWEIIEDVIFPLLSWWFGVPQLIPLFLIFHFEPVVYPLFFWAFRTWDRLMGHEPWEPDRPAYSTHWRTGLKTIQYKISSIPMAGCLFLALGIWNIGYLIAYTAVMAIFFFVHERTWHDSNFGIILETDEVEAKRTIAKAATYRLVSALMMGTLIHGILGYQPWVELFVYHLAMFIHYIANESVWTTSGLGIETSTEGESDGSK